MRRLMIVAAICAIAVSACAEEAGTGTSVASTVTTGGAVAGFGPNAIAVRASSDLGLGSERLLVGVRNVDGTELGSPDVPVTFLVAPLDEPELTQRIPAAFMWIIEGRTGLYRATVDFDRPGTWAVQLVPDSGDPLDAIPFTVQEKTFAPGLGATAPASPSATLADGSLEQISTDPDAIERFYEMTVAEAVSSGSTSVIIFATPAYCQTAACGPMLRMVRELAPMYPEMNFVHVEVYVGLGEDGFVPDAEHLAPAVIEWGLQTEPWVFVVDGNGIVTARFEGVLGEGELEAALS